MGTAKDPKALGKETSEKRRKAAAESANVLRVYFAKWQRVFPSQPMLPALPVYLEALSDLSPGMLEEGCKEASKRMTRFPAPGHIREAIPSRQEYAGPPALTYPEVSQEEREQAIADTQEFKRRIMAIVRQHAKKFSFYPPPPKRSLAEQKEILRKKGFLK